MATKKSDNKPTSSSKSKTKPPKEWTIMIYMAGDNNLSEDMIRAINEMKQGIEETGDHLKEIGEINNKNGVGLLVEFDGEHPIVPTRRHNLTYYPAIPYGTSSHYVVVPELPAPSAVTGTSHVPNPGSENRIERRIEEFVRYCVREQPADNYFLILSGHADSFQGKTLLLDENPSGAATIKGLSEALKRVTSTILHNKLEILAFDGCVMNSLEVIYQFRNVTKAWVGSQGSIPNYTWDYKEIMRALMNVPRRELSLETILEVAADRVQRYNFGYAFGGRSVDLSYCKMDQIREISRMLNYIARNIISLLGYYVPRLGPVSPGHRPDPNSLISNHISRLLLLAHWNCQPYMRNQAVDLVDFSERMAQECLNSMGELFSYCNATEEFVKDNLASYEKNISENLNESECLSEEARTLLGILFALYFLFNNLAIKLKETFKGISAGADYRFSNGVSIFLPWSFLTYRMTVKEYKDLDFSRDYKMWKVFIALYVRLTARPTQTINIEEILEGVLGQQFRDIFGFLFYVTNNLFTTSLLTVEDADSTNKALEEGNVEGSEKVDVQADLLMEKLLKIPGTKDNPNFTRGLDYYLFHFEKTNNIFPELEVKKSFR